MRNIDFRGMLASFAIFISLHCPPAAAQSFTIVHTFTADPHSEGPGQGLIRDEDGNLYGTTFGLLVGSSPTHYGTLFKVGKNGKTTTLVNFTGPNGANPFAGHLIRDRDGNLYGMTKFGGVLSGGALGNGVIYKVDRRGKQTILYVFKDGADGGAPLGTLVRDCEGNLYGMNLGSATNYGTVFKLSPNGKLTVLHTFVLGKGDGLSPSGGLVADRKGNLYGPTGGGSASAGAIVKITKAGKESVFYSFAGGIDGNAPNGDLLFDEEGNLYGTTGQGGASNFGTVFKIDPSGKETVLYSFKGPLHADGNDPFGGVVRDAAGNIYGTTWAGGNQANYGTVFKLDASGNESLLYTFPFGPIGSPGTGVILNEDGHLYGTTQPNPFEGYAGFGTVFKVAP